MTATGWISVKDRKPKVGVKVLTHGTGGLAIDWIVETDENGEYELEEEEWEEATFNGYSITHWMPLPDPPPAEAP